MRGLRAVGSVLLVVLLAACSRHVRHGSALYADGRYVEAAEVFEHTELRLRDASPREKAEYGTYRGLTLLVLGDYRNAHRWLAYAYEVERVFPGSLRVQQRAALDRGWQELGIRIQLRNAAPGQAVMAASQPQPPAAASAPRADDPAARRSLRDR